MIPSLIMAILAEWFERRQRMKTVHFQPNASYALSRRPYCTGEDAPADTQTTEYWYGVNCKRCVAKKKRGSKKQGRSFAGQL